MDTIADNEVVISGVGGHFPNCANLDEFKDALFSNEELLSSRWSEGERGVSNRLGVSPNVEFFDTSYFGIHRHQTIYMDPMQRMVLERTLEALVDAGVAPSEIRGRKVGVYMASSIGENDSVFYESIASGFGVTGHSRGMLSNRVSYWLNIKGPSCSYDSNWIGGFEVLQIAYNALKAGHVEAAIVGAANLCLNSEMSWNYQNLGVLSPDGKTKPFDENANGYARGDGFVVFYLQRASDAKRVYASIVNVGTQFMGSRGGMYLDHDVPCMIDFMSEFYERTGVNPENIEYLEAYGTGIKSIDEAELEAVEKVYCKNRKTPLQIGTVKPNTGHAEAAAVMLGICKVLIAMESGTIPGTINFKTPNKNIKGLTNGSLQVLTSNTPYKGGLMAVNGLGLSSSIGHIVLKPNPKVKQPIDYNLPALVIASSRTDNGMKEVLDIATKTQEKIDPEYFALEQSVFSKVINGHLYRGFKVLGENIEGLEGVEYYTGNKRQVWFVYSGMGSQWSQMGRDLLQLPIVSESIQKSSKILAEKGVDLINILTSDDPTIFDNILHSFVGIAAIQIALTDVLKALNIVPDGIIGHSVGELGCAYGDGALTAEEMILCAYSRGRASLEATLINGMMAAVGLGYDKIKHMVPPSIEVACHNGPDSSTISGPKEDMEKFVKQLQDQGVFARLVNVANIAYHSRYIKPAAPLLLKYLRDVIKSPKLRSSKWVSTSAPESKWNTEEARYSSAEYHTNNLLGSVLFEEGSRSIPKDSIVIEIAPHGLLQAILKRSLPSSCTNIPLTNRQAKNTLNFLLNAVGKMYLAGLEFNPSLMFPKVDFPVSRGTASLAPLVKWEHGEAWRIGIEHKTDYLVSIKEMQINIDTEEFKDTVGHKLDNAIIASVSTLLSFIVNILETNIKSKVNQFIFENLKFDHFLEIPKLGLVSFYAILQKGTGGFEISSDDRIVCTGKIRVPGIGDEFMNEPIPIRQSDDAVSLTSSDIYNEFLHRKHRYTDQFKTIKSMKLMEEGSICTLNCGNSWALMLEGVLQQILFQSGEKYQQTTVPKSILSISVAIDQFPADKEEIEVVHNYSTDIVYTTGLQVCGVKTRPFELKDPTVYYSSLEFVPFESLEVKNMENIINCSLQYALTNFSTPNCISINVTEIESENPSIRDVISNALRDYVDLNVNISSAKESNLRSCMSHTEPTLFVRNDVVTENILKTIASSEAFILCRSLSKDSPPHQDVVEYAKFQYNGDNFSLLRKACYKTPKMVHVKDSILTTQEVSPETSWLTDLKAATADKNTNVYLVSSVLPLEGITNFMKELHSIDQFNHVRLAFIEDKNVRELSNEVFTKDPILLVCKGGKLGSYIQVPVSMKANAKTSVYIPSQMENKTIEYIGVNLKDETISKNKKIKNETGLLDYVGKNQQGDYYVGVACLEKDTCKFIADPILKWKVPKHINIEDAATVPYAYSVAYYALVIKGNVQQGETLLVHSGCSPIGMASIAIALCRGCRVFTTAATVTQRAYLKKMFYAIKDQNIFSSETVTFESQFLAATSGLGADIIISNLSGSALEATSRCVAEYGRIIHIGKFDLQENNSIGMRVFLKNCVFISLDPANLMNINEDDKQTIHNLINEGLLIPEVRILPSKIIQNEDISDILSLLRRNSNVGKILIKVTDDFQISKLNVKSSLQYMCDTKASYFIYGGTADIWTDMVEWLVFRGARKILVSSEHKPQQAYINRRLALLQKNFSADIVFSSSRINSKESASELLSQVYYLGPIHAVFLLPNKTSDVKPLQHIETALRTIAPKAILMNFMKMAKGLFRQRIQTGFPTYNVECLTAGNFSQILTSLDYVLHLRVNNVLVKFEKITDFEEETSQTLNTKLAQMLPTLTEIIECFDVYDEDIILEQETTLGPREIRTLPPVFLFPGLTHLSYVREFASKIISPVFSVRLPAKPLNSSEVPKLVAEKIVQLYPRGPYNLVAMSNGGALAIETAKLLQKLKTTQLTFLDAAPESIQLCVKLLGEGPKAEITLLTRILNLNNVNVIESMRNSKSWEDRLQLALSTCKAEDRTVLQAALSSIKEQLQYSANYQPNGELVNGKVFLIRPTGTSKYDSCGLMKYVKRTPKIVVVSGDFLTMLVHHNLTDIINETLAVK